MSYIKINIHVIWSTKNRQRIISGELKPKLLEHIRKNAKEKNIFIDFINCVQEHVHAIISLNSDQCIGKIMQMIKGESSH
jgi:putative transposase